MEIKYCKWCKGKDGKNPKKVWKHDPKQEFCRDCVRKIQRGY